MGKLILSMFFLLFSVCLFSQASPPVIDDAETEIPSLIEEDASIVSLEIVIIVDDFYQTVETEATKQEIEAVLKEEPTEIDWTYRIDKQKPPTLELNQSIVMSKESQNCSCLIELYEKYKE